MSPHVVGPEMYNHAMQLVCLESQPFFLYGRFSSRNVKTIEYPSGK